MMPLYIDSTPFIASSSSRYSYPLGIRLSGLLKEFTRSSLE